MKPARQFLMRRLRSGLAALLVLAVAAPGVEASAEPPQTCFKVADNSRLDLEAYQQAPPPLPGKDEGFAYFPATAFATQSTSRILRAGKGRYALYYFQWANRSTEGVTSPAGERVPRKANFQPGWEGALDRRTDFSTVAKADVCTLAQTATVLGRPVAETDRALDDAGVRAARPASRTRSGLADAKDVCVLPPAALARTITGVMLDYEVQDGRSPDESLAFLTRFAELVHHSGKRALLMTNPLNAPTQIYTGVTAANANRIHRLFDRTTLFAWSGAREGDIEASLENQWRVLAAGGSVDPARVIVDFELANTSQADAAAVRRFVQTRHLAGVLFWRNHAQQGGACDSDVNRKIACLGLGACAPQ